MGVTLEIAVQDVSGAAAAVASGADRLELCSALAATGGLTPSQGLLDATLAAVPGVGVHPLVRPRPGGFVYAPDELDVQVRDVRAAVRAGARGVVVGALTPAGAIDTAALERLVEAADGVEVTFHRAFDVLDDVAAGVGVLAAFGVTRVLTSGGAQRAGDGLARLRETVEAADGRVQVMAGGGVRVEDLVRILGTGVDAVHLSASRVVAGDGGPGGGGDAGWTTTDPGVVAAARAAVGTPR
ncbi:copper homeostasis protein CutC [Cellulomonas massiliensis]|uniref:copper homeostasis protein CutC n=1 Tax=Cellulomonas massiliensis TaxID=1465811 RepID=UPI000317BC5C|nr:copper homeostasis protein CutC [Cellulomonas massiliensis]